MINFSLLFHIIGLIIGLGAVSVIDMLGFKSRKSKELTQVTIHAHHVTKPMIWVGTIMIILSWIFLYDSSLISNIKSLLLLIMVLNGSFLSFYISPRLDKMIGKNILLPKDIQIKITISMLISFFSWWTFVVLTVMML